MLYLRHRGGRKLARCMRQLATPYRSFGRVFHIVSAPHPQERLSPRRTNIRLWLSDLFSSRAEASPRSSPHFHTTSCVPVRSCHPCSPVHQRWLTVRVVHYLDVWRIGSDREKFSHHVVPY